MRASARIMVGSVWWLHVADSGRTNPAARPPSTRATRRRFRGSAHRGIFGEGEPFTLIVRNQSNKGPSVRIRIPVDG